MILVDTAVWADHFGRSDEVLAGLLEREQVLGHAFVTAEMALGNLADPLATIAMLNALPQAYVATHAELMTLIEHASLSGSGIGFVDTHLLAAASLSGALLWTRDKRLRAQAERLELAWAPT